MEIRRDSALVRKKATGNPGILLKELAHKLADRYTSWALEEEWWLEGCQLYRERQCCVASKTGLEE